MAERIVGAPVPRGEPLMQAGLDSLGAVDLRREMTTLLQLGGSSVFHLPKHIFMWRYKLYAPRGRLPNVSSAMHPW